MWRLLIALRRRFFTCLMKKSPWIKDTRPKFVYLNTWSISHIILCTTCKGNKGHTVWSALVLGQKCLSCVRDHYFACTCCQHSSFQHNLEENKQGKEKKRKENKKQPQTKTKYLFASSHGICPDKEHWLAGQTRGFWAPAAHADRVTASPWHTSISGFISPVSH